MLLLSGSVSFLPEIHLQSYPGSMVKVDDAKDEPYVPTVGKAKPGVLRKTYKSMKQSDFVKLCRYGLLYINLLSLVWMQMPEKYKEKLR